MTTNLTQCEQSRTQNYEEESIIRLVDRKNTSGLTIIFTLWSEIYITGNLLTWEEIKPIQKKTQAILELQVPTTLELLQSFLGIVQFYRNMWKHYSHALAPLIVVMGKGKKEIEWTEVHQTVFEDTNKGIAK